MISTGTRYMLTISYLNTAPEAPAETIRNDRTIRGLQITGGTNGAVTINKSAE